MQVIPMETNTHDLPAIPNFCFSPDYGAGPPGETQQIRIFVDGMPGSIPTSLIALNLKTAETVCDRFNARLGLSRDQWTRFVARSLRRNRQAAGSTRLH